jgi:hypothetical protein
MKQEELVNSLFGRACKLLKLTGFKFQVMKRTKPIKNLKGSYRISYINLKTKKVVIDVYTPRLRQPKKPSVILRIIAHELAHWQKPPYRQYWNGRVINRIHYPAFYKQVKKNIQTFKKDDFLGQFFT